MHIAHKMTTKAR